MRRSSSFDRIAAWKVEQPAAYAYLLGCYLGDGYISHQPPHTWTLRISCDRAYPAIEAEIAEAISAVFPGTNPRLRRIANERADVVGVTHPAIGRAFPQHGRGPKHRRAIRLADWQLEITHAHPEALIRGLIHSDGCRAMNRVRTVLPSGRLAEYTYPRYFFSNVSSDIRQVFCDHCVLLGIRVTHPNPRNVGISNRPGVAILDRIVDRKR